MNSFYVWIVCLTKAYEQQINSALINAGYSVAALSSDGKVAYPGTDSSAILVYNITKIGEVITYQTVYDLVISILTNLNVRFFAVIITLPTQCTWTGSNFKLSDPEILSMSPKKGMLN